MPVLENMACVDKDQGDIRSNTVDTFNNKSCCSHMVKIKVFYGVNSVKKTQNIAMEKFTLRHF